MESAAKRNENVWKKVKPLVFKTIIGSLIAAALIGVFAVVTGEFDSLSLQLTLTVVIIIGFSLLAWYDADVSSKRSHGFALIGTAVSVYLLFAGIGKIWLVGPGGSDGFYDSRYLLIGSGFGDWLVLVFFARFALLHAHLLLNIHRRYATPTLQVVAKVTMGLIVLLAVLLSLHVLISDVNYSETYWRFTGAVVILNVLGTVLIPISNALFGPKKELAASEEGSLNPSSPAYESFAPPVRPEALAPATQPAVVAPKGSAVFAPAPTFSRRLAWPRYEDGTPLPANSDGSPNFDEVERH